MVVYPVSKRLKLALTPAFAIAVGACVALACMVMPSSVLEAMILDSGVPALLPAAEPPLGWTARTALAMIAGGGASAAAWLAAFLLLGGEGIVSIPLSLPRLPDGRALARWIGRLRPARTVADADASVPVLRRADAHPDAPARAPLLATRDLGTPFLEVRAPAPVERDLPRDLDAPLSAFDPHAIPEVPAEPIRAIAPLHAVPNPAVPEDGERFEAFELRPPVPQPLSQPPIAAPRTDATIHALLDRLERGVSTRTPSGAAPGDALNELRRLATR